ncbi:histidine phosphatase family protein [Kineosporia sp. J2-2]|uniref:Histidine phosphatase family protein n=1 Tax=Kineosporia corallincola TaxID=2835133 RepID=A0ABS5TSC7_9ACTN|nr:histidine phosphatase family protein [Kineosporia corallincola]MBT0773716.1 histidine phosphatase family protein [Kineosporia corallincola]
MQNGELTIARHGQAWCNTEQVIEGPDRCRGLTPTGRQQAEFLAQRLAIEHTHHPYDALYTSPIPRAAQTADAIAQTTGLAPNVIEDLREPDYGAADGCRWEEVIAQFGAAPNLYPERPLAAGAESSHHHQKRVHHALRELLERHRGQRVLLVGHGETVTAAHHFFCGLDSAETLPLGFAAHQSALTTWQQQPVSWLRPGDGQRWVLLCHNDIAHIAGAR